MDETTDTAAQFSHDEQTPRIMDYAGLQACRDAPRLRSPTGPVRWSWGCALASLLCLVIALAAKDDVLFLALFFGFVIAILSLSCGYSAWLRKAVWQRSTPTGTAAPRLWLAFAVSLLLAASHGLLLYRVSGLADSPHSSPRNLEILAWTMRTCQAKLGAVPRNLNSLFQESKRIDPSLLWMFDEQRRVFYRSPQELAAAFAYEPGLYPSLSDPAIVIAFEKAPCAIREVRLFPEASHLVLFADGKVHYIRRGDLQTVLEQDRKRREELGWPVCDSTKMYP